MKSAFARIVGLVVVIFAAGFAAILVAFVFSWAMGWMTAEKVDGMVEAMRSGKQATTETAKTENPEEELSKAREAMEAMRKSTEAQVEKLNKEKLDTERKKIELESVRQDARRAVAELDARTKALGEQVKRFEAEKQAYEDSLASEGMRKLKETFEEMEAGKAAAMLYEYDINTTAKVLGAMRKDDRAAVLGAIIDMDKKKGLTEATGRAGQIMKVMANLSAMAVR